jgi:hypothetical protein
MHVSKVPGFGSEIPGQSPTADEVIARWCAATEWVLVTTDEDFRGRWWRSGLLRDHGVEVIVFDRDIAGLSEQHRRITLHYGDWQATLAANKYGFRVWRQGSKGPPRPLQRPSRGGVRNGQN